MSVVQYGVHACSSYSSCRCTSEEAEEEPTQLVEAPSQEDEVGVLSCDVPRLLSALLWTEA